MGMFLAWKVRVDAGVDMAEREAVVRESQRGELW